MILISVFLVFTALFALITYENFQTFDIFSKDLIKSLSMYARTFGNLPNHINQEIPWEKIGISKTFFSNNIRYEANQECTKNNLTPPDFKIHVRNSHYNPLAINHFAYITKDPIFETHEYKKFKFYKTIYAQAKNPFQIKINKKLIIVDMNTLAYYANYPIFVCAMDMNIENGVFYNMASQQYILNISAYY